jgi:hypothetical protein
MDKIEKKEKIITHKRTTPIKQRSSSCYQNKIKKITKWYNNLLKCRENPKGNNLINPNTKEEPKRKELKPLKYYIELLTNPKGESK